VFYKIKIVAFGEAILSNNSHIIFILNNLFD